jgi:hypothetical protein
MIGALETIRSRKDRVVLMLAYMREGIELFPIRIGI